jgi:hypothetical protein
MLGQQLQLLIKNFEALLRYLIRHDVVDTDLQIVEPGIVQFFDAVGRQQITVGDQTCQGGVFADAGNDVI